LGLITAIQEGVESPELHKDLEKKIDQSNFLKAKLRLLQNNQPVYNSFWSGLL
jgi:hypothetical protein